MMINIITAVFLSYLLGAIPFSFLLGKLLKGIDIRHMGSGNIGATNLMRCAGKPIGITALVLDMSKGTLAVTVIADIFYSSSMPLGLSLFKIILGLLAVIGHIWTVMLKFRGGKGVATAIGVLAGLSPFVVIYSGLVWLAILLVSKYVSLSSIVMALCLPVFTYLSGQPAEYTLLSVGLCVLIICRHRGNIARLIKGTEYKVGQKAQ
ncbi:MAG: glycerol-3-phosphate 1-O-acyltransferase PlsY [Candidatus Omnitrophica bacterium]|nr:glycerol-3-phosphate 1-O-acyltransferase PlsY [Candidatus Omnitrophota bacterium]